MDRKREILDYIYDKRLDLLEELKETEVKLQETVEAVVPQVQDLSVIMSNFRSLEEHIEHMLHNLDELEVRVMNSWLAILKTALLRATTYRKDMTNMWHDVFFRKFS